MNTVYVSDEMYEDVVSIAAPIKDYTGKVIASVSTIGPRNRIHEGDNSALYRGAYQNGKSHFI